MPFRYGLWTHVNALMPEVHSLGENLGPRFRGDERGDNRLWARGCALAVTAEGQRRWFASYACGGFAVSGARPARVAVPGCGSRDKECTARRDCEAVRSACRAHRCRPGTRIDWPP